MALYLSDVLSRDRLHTTVVDDNDDCACHLAYLPIGRVASGGALGDVFRFLTQDTVTHGDINTTIAVIGKYIELGNGTYSETAKHKYYRLAQNSLMEDIGVFPLLRPTVHFVAHANIAGAKFDRQGMFETVKIVKLRIPTRSTGADQ